MFPIGAAIRSSAITWNPLIRIGAAVSCHASKPIGSAADSCAARFRSWCSADLHIRRSGRLNGPQLGKQVARRSHHRLHQTLQRLFGVVVRPVCTGDVWMIVLRGETSQWKRARCGSSPIGPASAPPRQTRGIIVEVALRSPPRSIAGSSASSRATSSSIARLEEIGGRAGEDDAGVDELAALDARDDADDGVVIRVLSGHGRPPRRTPAAPPADRAGSAVRVARRRRPRPSLRATPSGTCATIAVDHRRRQQRAPSPRRPPVRSRRPAAAARDP